MISIDFQYIRPNSIEEALLAFKELDEKGLSPVYYAGGTEIITNARKQTLKTGAVIDLKGVPECCAHEEKEGNLVFGATLNLTEIMEKNLFPFLSKVCRPIADHTVRNKLTLGGNICGRLPYREAILPLLLVDTKVVIAGPEGTKTLPLSEAFDKRLILKKGEFLAQISVPKEAVNLPHFNKRRVKQTEVDYPIVHVTALLNHEKIRFSVSGACPLPFRSNEMEDLLNNKNDTLEDRINKTIEKLPMPLKKDQWASEEYRKALLKKSLYEMLASLEGVSL
jgi:xanthine dehydrogenase molybdenum-binding subunit